MPRSTRFRNSASETGPQHDAASSRLNHWEAMIEALREKPSDLPPIGIVMYG